MRTLLIVAVAGMSIGMALLLSNSVATDQERLLLRTVVSPGNKAMTLFGVRMIERKKNIDRMEMLARKALVYPDESRTELESFSMLSQTGTHGSVSVTAERGTMINNGDDISAIGHVMVRDEHGRTLLTRTLRMQTDIQKVTTSDKVRLIGDSFLVTGTGMVAHLADERVEILTNVTAIFQPVAP